MSISFIQYLKADLLMWQSSETWTSYASSFCKHILITPGFQLVFLLRIQQGIRGVPLFGRLISKIIWYFNTVWFGADLNPGTIYGAGLYFPHTVGIVIGHGCVIGKNVTILQQVTLGRKVRGEQSGPQLGNNVAIFAGAKVLGNISIGSGSIVGANAVVTKDVDHNQIAVGVPAKCYENKELGG